MKDESVVHSSNVLPVTDFQGTKKHNAVPFPNSPNHKTECQSYNNLYLMTLEATTMIACKL